MNTDSDSINNPRCSAPNDAWEHVTSILEEQLSGIERDLKQADSSSDERVSRRFRAGANLRRLIILGTLYSLERQMWRRQQDRTARDIRDLTEKVECTDLANGDNRRAILRRNREVNPTVEDDRSECGTVSLIVGGGRPNWGKM